MMGEVEEEYESYEKWRAGLLMNVFSCAVLFREGASKSQRPARPNLEPQSSSPPAF